MVLENDDGTLGPNGAQLGPTSNAAWVYRPGTRSRLERPQPLSNSEQGKDDQGLV